MKQAAVLVLALLLGGSVAQAVETQKMLSLAAADIGVLDVDAGAGSLSISGREGAESIEVRATVRVTGIREKDFDKYLDDHLELSLEKRGDRAVLVAKLRERGFSFFGRDATVDLEVTVPRRLALEIDDGSGEISLKNISGDVRIDDGSGDIHVDGISGDLDVDDASGDIKVREVGGDVLVDDSSGSITIRHVGGKVTVSDGSGSIDIDDVGGDVRLRSTGSGGVEVTNVRGRVIR